MRQHLDRKQEEQRRQHHAWDGASQRHSK
jgi:hypothetical protein